MLTGALAGGLYVWVLALVGGLVCGAVLRDMARAWRARRRGRR